MPSNTLAAFTAGLFVATLVLTHDASIGDELLVQRGLLLRGSKGGLDEFHVTQPDSNVVQGRFERHDPLDALSGETSPEDITAESPQLVDISDDTSVEVTHDTHTDQTATPPPSVSPTHDFSKPLTTREAFAAAMASTRLALRLWAIVGRPVMDTVEWYTKAGSKELISYLWKGARIIGEAPPETLLTFLAVVVGILATRLMFLALIKHLRRARYVFRAKEKIACQRRRILRVRDKAIAPFIAVRRRVTGIFVSGKRKYASFILSVKTKSRVAAFLAPHFILFGVGAVVVWVLPEWARGFVRKREVVASVTLIIPTFCTVSALEKCRVTGVDGWSGRGGSGSLVSLTDAKGSGIGLGVNRAGRAVSDVTGAESKSKLISPEHARNSAEAWLRFWSSAAPLMFLLDLPFVATGVHLLFPVWPELTLLWTAWLTFPMTNGAKLLTDFAAPKVQVWMVSSSGRGNTYAADKNSTTSDLSLSRRITHPLRNIRRILDSSAHRSLRNIAWVLQFCGFRKVGKGLRLALDNASLPMIGCAVFFFTPGFLTGYGCATAALALPAAASLDALAVRDASTGSIRIPSDRSKNICAQLRYWLAYSMLWSLVRELSRGALSWFPLWRHVELLCVFWLAVFGGADEVTRRMFAAKEGIVSEHHKAAARAQLAKEQVRALERGSGDAGSRDSMASVPSNASADQSDQGESLPDETESEGGSPVVFGSADDLRHSPVGISEETLRRRGNKGGGE